ncbi:uncharacterized protein LOC127841507 [Dreissena polymorpha]|uniref:Uncharacterized protein n=1 Tax=Dreissena polymorpha TaxID=45954 RepID=A0A9D4EZY2_DREPO|nr:uncharacterized protein LOC127841507 [Dreissena polymorpha]KAH3789864.1 hypothetical protein DPMN_168053 [Dreissena polymorpha]
MAESQAAQGMVAPPGSWGYPAPNTGQTYCMPPGQYQAPMMPPGQQGMYYPPGAQPYYNPYGHMMPQMQGPPGSSQMVPQMIGIPGSGQMMPQMQGVPGSGQMMPQMQGVPGSGQMVPPMMPGAPGYPAVVGQLAAAVDPFANSADAAVKRGLHNVKVSRFDATEVERQLQGELFDKWHESCEVVKATKIQFSRIEGYLDHLMDAYEGITPETRKKMDGVLWAEGEWEYRLMEWKFNKGDNSEARYGMIAFGRSPDKQFVDCMYVMYKMDFKVAPQVIVERKDHSMLWGLITWQTLSQHTVERSLGTKDIERLKNFFRSKAMEGFYKEGVIEKINYVTSLEDIPKDDIKS